MQAFHKKRKGFTLIELLVVIAIIGILATIVLVSLNTARQKARDVRRIGDLRQVALALEMYYDDNASYPTYTPCSNASWLSMGGDISPTYMTAVPDDPVNSGSNVYMYSSDATGTEYALRAYLENVNNSALDTDVDGDALGCTIGAGASCDDPAYCIQP
jgi:type II secretion system protein G